ncbi:hypothetical protein TRVL_04157 [Trypanosoma vivax]|nr:hypothetical protein TRVL_04157 [Trypanosoma vivax]
MAKSPRRLVTPHTRGTVHGDEFTAPTITEERFLRATRRVAIKNIVSPRGTMRTGEQDPAGLDAQTAKTTRSGDSDGRKTRHNRNSTDSSRTNGRKGSSHQYTPRTETGSLKGDVAVNASKQDRAVDPRET